MISHRSLIWSLRSVERRNNTRKIFLSTEAPPKVVALKLNCNHAIVKAAEGCSFRELVQKPVKTLQGIGPVHEAQLAELGIKSVQELTDYKFFHLARAIQTLATTEEVDNRSSKAAVMNINKGVDKAYETQSFKEILQAPVHALQGISEKAGATWKHLGVKTVNDLANWKYANWAVSLQVVSKYEE